MIPLIAAGVLAAALAAPHLVGLDAAPPTLAAAIWLSALLLRAATTVVVIAFLVIVVPATGVFDALSHWCWHTVVPLVTTHLGLNGHSVVDAAMLFPAVVLAFSAVSVAFGLFKAARKVKSILRDGLGPGPSDSLIITDGTVVVAAAGLRHPRVIVSAGALTVLDDAELYASLDHEHGHIDHRHRWILVLGELSRALGRFVPGAHTALAELTFHLERDADRYALSRRHAPRDLASAICKAAQGGLWSVTPASGLCGAGVVWRVSQLWGDDAASASPAAARALAAAMVTIVIAVFAAVPSATMA
ncbi:MAG: M56 family metallopeptidase, partial [Solirubrobacteraceae bacterium]